MLFIRRQNSIIITVCTVLLCILLTACQQGADTSQSTLSTSADTPLTQLNTTMHCTELSPEGEPGLTFDATLQVNIETTDDGSTLMLLALSQNDAYPYILENTDYGYSTINEFLGLPYYVVNALGYSKKANAMIPVFSAVDMQKQCMAVLWNHEVESMLVASADPNLDADAIISHFQQFIDSYLH